MVLPCTLSPNSITVVIPSTSATFRQTTLSQAIIATVTLQQAIATVTTGRDLSEQESQAAMAEIMGGGATPSQIAALAIGLKMKGEAVDEIVGFAREMRAHSVKVKGPPGVVVDTCGTGGSNLKTFNISTASAIVAAAAGVKVAKHGNRGVTRGCGSADVLEALGVKLVVSPDGCQRLLESVGIAFLFAPAFHPAMRHAAGPRKEIGVRTIFNLLGPLTNPAGANRQILGVSDLGLVEKMSKSLARLGTVHSIVAYGEVGIDDIAPIGTTHVAIVQHENISAEQFVPDQFGISEPTLGDIAARETVEENAALVKMAVSDVECPQSRAIIPNAAAAVWIAGIATDIASAADVARSAIRSGAALNTLDRLAFESQGVGENA